MSSFFKEYFTFSRGERNGIIVLLLLIIFLIALPYLLKFLKQQKEIDFAQFQKEIAEFEKHQALANDKKFTRDTTIYELFNFDPNEITEADWQRLGVSEKTARTIINYRNKGGYFDEKTDLLKIYGLDSVKYEKLEPYIVFNENNEEKEMIDPFDKTVFRKPERKQYQNEISSYGKKTEFKRKENIIVELNNADTTALMEVRGIGPAFSKRIIKYRTLLGGFVSVSQLSEIYGMDSVWFETMRPSLRVDSMQVVKIPINDVTQQELEKHPYFGRNIARAIVNYRQQHGSFASIDDLRKVYLINEGLFEKIKPYVTMEDGRVVANE